MINLIYITTNLINGKQYVGKHTTELLEDGYLGSGEILNKAINKYGRNYFKRETIEICQTPEELDYKEIYWIKEKNTLAPNGYNVTKGGTGGDTFTNNPNKEQTRNRRSNGVKKYWDNLSEEDKEKRINLIRGKKRSNESKKKYSKAKKGIKKSPEHLENLSKSLKKVKKGKRTYNQKSVLMYDLEMNLIKEFESIQQAGRETGYNPYAICKICKGQKEIVP